jgi:hypothetical protein
MSDFASLLGNLEDTASKVKDLSATDRVRNPNKNTRSSHAEIPPRKKRRIQDLSQLTVKVSFLGIGAQKAGTTWLHEMLRKHPDLCLPEQKEIHFWDWPKNRRKGLGWYSDQFQQGPKEKLRGEITPCYCALSEDDICEIKDIFPDLKIIFIARDIVDRAYSALVMELRNSVRGIPAGNFAIEDNVNKKDLDRFERDANPSKYSDDYFMDRLRHSTHRERNDYAKALRSWLKFIPESNLLILNYDDISSKPKETLEDVCNHLGVQVQPLLDVLSNRELTSRVNATPRTAKGSSLRLSLRRKMEVELNPLITEFNGLLSDLNHSWKLKE